MTSKILAVVQRIKESKDEELHPEVWVNLAKILAYEIGYILENPLDVVLRQIKERLEHDEIIAAVNRNNLGSYQIDTSVDRRILLDHITSLKVKLAMYEDDEPEDFC